MGSEKVKNYITKWPVWHPFGYLGMGICSWYFGITIGSHVAKLSVMLMPLYSITHWHKGK